MRGPASFLEWRRCSNQKEERGRGGREPSIPKGTGAEEAGGHDAWGEGPARRQEYARPPARPPARAHARSPARTYGFAAARLRPCCRWSRRAAARACQASAAASSSRFRASSGSRSRAQSRRPTPAPQPARPPA
eukprot:4227089-Pleurochrysis_carterae.AAC.2